MLREMLAAEKPSETLPELVKPVSGQETKVRVEMPLPVQDELLVPLASRPTETAPAKIIEIPMPTKPLEQDRTPTALTLPEPALPLHLSPYVEEMLTPPRASITEYEAPTLESVSALPYEESLPFITSAEQEVPAEQQFMSDLDLSAEIEKIINAEPAPETAVDLTSWAEFTAAHDPDIEREPTPLESFTYFTKSLEDWHDTPGLKVAETTDEPDIATELPAEFEIPQADKKAMIAISHEVAERLTHLEPVEVEEAAPVIAEISTVINKLQELSNPKTEEDIIALAETKEELEELCKQLFEALDIEYDQVSINYFIQVMLLKQFKTSMDMIAYKDRLGTHEFKHHFPALGAMAQLIAGEVFHFVLGRLALLQTNPQEKRQLAQSRLSV